MYLHFIRQVALANTFRSSSQAATCLLLTRWRLHISLYLLNVMQGSCEYQCL